MIRCYWVTTQTDWGRSTELHSVPRGNLHALTGSSLVYDAPTVYGEDFSVICMDFALRNFARERELWSSLVELLPPRPDYG